MDKAASPGDPALGISHPIGAFWFWVASWSFHVFSLPLGMSLLNINQILLWAQNEAATGLVLLNWDPV